MVGNNSVGDFLVSVSPPQARTSIFFWGSIPPSISAQILLLVTIEAPSGYRGGQLGVRSK